MRVLQVFNHYLEHGGEEVWVNQLPALTQGSLEVNDLRFHSDAWIGAGAPSRLKQFLHTWDNPASREQLRISVDNFKPDALLFHNLIPVGSFGLYDEARKLGLPVLQYIHNYRPFSPSGTLWLKNRVSDAALHGNTLAEVMSHINDRSFFKNSVLAFWQKKLLKSGWLDSVESWIAVSGFMRGKFVEAGMPPDKVTQLRHCWKPRDSLPSTPEKNYYLFLGRLVPEKGTNTMLEAWRILENRLANNCPNLVIAGAGPQSAAIHAAAAKLKHVTCMGYVSGSSKDHLLLGCRALIAPSIWWEPLGLIVYEAYDCARPVLAARSGGLIETVVPELTGFLHDPGNAMSLAADVERMESLGTLGRASMGDAGRAWLTLNASPEQWKSDFLEIVRKACSRQTE